MRFRLPMELYQEDECVLNHSGDLALLGTKALIVTGHSSERNGALDDVKAALEKEEIAYEIFNEVEENPSLETVVRIRDTFVNKNVDFVIGLGGGSAMDAAKAAAILLYFPEKDGSFLYESVQKVYSLPIAAIPTTCGTGSEATPSAVLTLHERKTKNSVSHKIFPALGLVDPKYLNTLPLHVLRNSAIDALSHLIESTVNSTSTGYSRMISLEGLRLFGKLKGAIEEGVFSKQDQWDLMLMATLGGMSIALTGTSLPHGASYPVTYNTGMAHGKACGYFQYGYLRNASGDDQRLVLDNLGFENLEQLRDYIIKVCDIKPLDESLLEMSLAELMGNTKKLRVSPFETSEENLRKMIFALNE